MTRGMRPVLIVAVLLVAAVLVYGFALGNDDDEPVVEGVVTTDS